jgi:hypothetical protein
MDLKKGIIAIVAAVVAVGFTGCMGEKQAFIERLETNRTYHKMLQRTEVADLTIDKKKEGVLLASYLYTPTLEKRDLRDDVFIVALHFDNHKRVTEAYVKESITLFGKVSLTDEEAALVKEFGVKRRDENVTATHIRALTQEEAKAKKLSFVTPWSYYFELRFPHMESDKIRLRFDDGEYTKTQLVFTRRFKYIYSGTGF